MSKTRILIIDDEIPFTRMLKANLEGLDRFEVRVENCPEESLAVAKAFQPHLVLMDVFMPRLSGGDVAAQLQANPGTCSIPIIFLTAAISRPRMKQHAGFILGTRVIAKPASLEEIVSSMDQCLAQATQALGAPLNTMFTQYGIPRSDSLPNSG